MSDNDARQARDALVIVDIQRDYFPGGGMPLVGPEEAAASAAAVLAHYRRAGGDIIHVQHEWDDPDATFMRPGTDGIKIHELVEPAAGEIVLTKTAPNSFLGTGLEDTLRGRGVDHVTVLGMMTSTCVDSTVRAAADLGFGVTVVHNACAAPDLEFGGQTVTGDVVHAAFIAALADDFADVVSSAELTGSHSL